MKIKKILSQHRRDFQADFVCEHCGHVDKDVKGYDDDNFHKNVIPTWPCDKCGKTAPDDYQPKTPLYAAGEVV